VRNAAAAALGATRAPSAHDALAKALGVDSWRDRVRQGALEGLAALRDPKAIPELLAYTRRGVDEHTRGVALSSAAQLGALLKQPDPSIRDAGAVLLADDDFDTEESALYALGQTGDPEALDVLDHWQKAAPADQLRKAAGEAADSVRETIAARAAGGEVERQLDELRAKIDEMKHRMDAEAPHK
jgi:aminopeptidase N